MLPTASTGRSTAVDVLFVAQFVVAVRGVVALAGKEWLQAVLAADVHRQKLLAVLRENHRITATESPLER